MNTKLQMQGEHDIESTRRAYFLREKARNDYVSAMTLATRKSRQEGKAEGKRELVQGLMSKKGLSVQEIAELISLTTAAGQGIPQGQKRKNQQTSNENNSDHSDTERANFMK